MGMFDFLKKKNLPIKEKVLIESFEDAEKIFNNKSDVLNKKEEEVLVEIRGKFEDFYVSVEEKLKVLEGVDIESKKEHKRTMILVRQGLEKYIDFVRVLLRDLRRLEKNDFSNFIREVSEVFVIFEKTSFKVYERATYLIGDEMMAVRNEIRKFYSGLLEMFEKEKLLIGDLKKIENIKLKLGEIEVVKNSLENLNGEISANSEGMEKARVEVRRLSKEIDVIKDSSEYVSGLAISEMIKSLEVGLNGEIAKLKNLIDFKKLVGVVHSNQRELEIAKGYRDHFVFEFSHNGKKLLDLLEGANMKSSEIEAQFLLIEKKSGELIKKRKSVESDVSVVKLKEIKRIKERIKEIEIDNVKVESKLKELSLKLKKLKSEVIDLIEGGSWTG